MLEEAPPTVGVVEVQDQTCGRWSGKNGTQLFLAIMIGRAQERVVTASSSHETEKTGVPSTLSATPAAAGVTTLPRAKLSITLTRSTGEAATTLVCVTGLTRTPLIHLRSASLTKELRAGRNVSFISSCCWNLMFAVSFVLMLRFCSRCQCV